MKKSLTAFISTILLSTSVLAQPTSVETGTALPAQQQAFFDKLLTLCGKAFEGKVAVDTPKSGGFEGKLVMHVRQCTNEQIHIPFHVGDDSSRTWIITKSHSGLQLKHDHRHKDGSHDDLTMYGGMTIDQGYAQVQSFPADQFTKHLFVNLAIPQSNDNTWQMFIYPETFTYRMLRPAREFKVEFDLTKPITPPKAPWGY